MTAPPINIGRYELFDELASGGMATVHLARQTGAAGFVRTVAVKRLHERYARDPVFVAMFLDEARLVARIRHPNVVPTLDVVAQRRELYLVMEYVHGDSLSRLAVAADVVREPIPLPVLSAIITQALHGLHAAHEATTERGEPLGLVHRDISPQNIMVGVDGVARVVDFGVAKAAARAQWTEDGQLKGKLGYMSPEQVRLQEVDRRTDIFAMGVVLWELLANRRLIDAPDPAGKIAQIADLRPLAPSTFVAGLPAALDALVLKALAVEPGQRFATAEALADALAEAVPPAHPPAVASWVKRLAFDTLERRARQLSAMEHARPVDAQATPIFSSTPPPRHSSHPTIVDARVDTAVSRRRRRSVLLWAAALVATFLASLLGAAGVAFGGREGRGSAVATAPTAVASASGASPVAAPASVSAAPSALPSPPAQASGSAELLPAPVVLRPSAKQPPAATPPTKRPANSPCDPPYVIVDGLKRFKPECL